MLTIMVNNNIMLISDIDNNGKLSNGMDKDGNFTDMDNNGKFSIWTKMVKYSEMDKSGKFL